MGAMECTLLPWFPVQKRADKRRDGTTLSAKYAVGPCVTVRIKSAKLAVAIGLSIKKITEEGFGEGGRKDVAKGRFVFCSKLAVECWPKLVGGSWTKLAVGGGLGLELPAGFCSKLVDGFGSKLA